LGPPAHGEAMPAASEPPMDLCFGRLGDAEQALSDIREALSQFGKQVGPQPLQSGTGSQDGVFSPSGPRRSGSGHIVTYSRSSRFL